MGGPAEAWRDWGRALIRGVALDIWPNRCPLCAEVLAAEADDPFCPGCRATIVRMTEPVCDHCGRSLPETGPASGVCGACVLEPPRYDLARIYGVYQGALATAIKDFKFKHRRVMRPALSRLLLETDEQGRGLETADVVVPVPLHPERLRERGFNQAADLAAPVARRRQVLLLRGVLVRTRPTEPQFGLSAAGRRSNLKGAFAVTGPAEVKGRSVLLIDDIITSGTTVIECAKALKKAGATRVLVLALAGAGGLGPVRREDGAEAGST